MSKYIHFFNSTEDLDTYVSTDYVEPFLAMTQVSPNVYRYDFDGTYTPQIDYSKEPMTFDVLTGGTLYWKSTSTSITKTIQYSLNDGDWTNVTTSTGGNGTTVATLSSGDIIKFRGSESAYGTSNSVFSLFVSDSTLKFNAYGNVQSLMYPTDFDEEDTASGKCGFTGMFRGCNGLVSVENMVFPSAILDRYMFFGMFSGCTSLVSGPKILPAMTLSAESYTSMFENCSSLVNAPQLPATTAVAYCYSAMFKGCTSLTTAPDILLTDVDTTAHRAAMRYMFSGCTSLNYIKCLSVAISRADGFTDWVAGVSPTGTFVKHPSNTAWTTGPNGIPEGWTIQDATI